MISILLVDDDRLNRKTISIVLAEAGYEVRLAENGSDAIRAFTQERPALVLLDVMMPGMDGFDVCRKLRKLDRETPIIFLSALSTDESQVKGLAAGADDYVSKTASDELLLARVKRALERAGRFAATPAPKEMTKTEADIYRLLKSSPGRLFSYREIFSAAFGDGYSTDEGTVRSHVSRMRPKIPAGEKIESKRGFGFCLRRAGETAA